jgi:hypothetical protein
MADNLIIFLSKIKLYFFKIVGDLRDGKFEMNNDEQNKFLAIILMIIGTLGLIIFED